MCIDKRQSTHLYEPLYSLPVTWGNGELQSLINRTVEVNGKMGTMVNIEKTDVQHVGPERVNIVITIGRQKLKQVQDYVYLGEQ